MLAETRRDARLADPRFAGNQHDLPFALPGEALAFHQKTDLVFAPDQSSSMCRADCFETAFGIGWAFDYPSRDWLLNALDLMATKVAQMEETAEQSARRGG